MTYNFKDYNSDFEFLSEVKTFLKNYLNKKASQNDHDILKKGKYSQLEDDRCIRIVLPQGTTVFENISLDDNLYFVYFVGFAKQMEEISEDLRQEVWTMDSRLIEEFSKHTDILAYVSAQRKGLENWGNMVLLKSPEAVDKWRCCAVHRKAITTISPKYYTKVRIHRGQIHNGETKAEQTLFLDYTGSAVVRTEHLWI